MKPLKYLDFFIPLFLLALLTLLFRATDLDLKLESLLFVQGKGWVFANNNPWAFLYRYGPYPAVVLAAGSFLAFAGSFLLPRLVFLRKKALFLVLLMLIGPGLVVNVVFKDHWGRPRPRQVTEFNAHERFLPVLVKGVSSEGKSFPCGHASMGFYLLAPYFLFQKKSRRWSLFFLHLGLAYGTLMGLGRMIQGGHFASDVVWSCGFVYLCGWGLWKMMESRLWVMGYRLRARSEVA